MPLTGKESENYYLSRIVELLGGGAELPTRGKENTTYYLERIVDLLQAGAIGSLPVAAGDDVTRLEVQISGTAATTVDLEVPFDCTITGWTMLADVAGSIVVDIWRDALFNHPPTDADSITNGHEPTIAGATNAQDNDLSDWTSTVLQAGQILRFNVDSAATLTTVTLSLRVRLD